MEKLLGMLMLAFVLILTPACDDGKKADDESKEKEDKDKNKDMDKEKGKQDGRAQIKPKDETPAPEFKMTSVDLSEAGLSATIQAPEGSTAKDAWGTIEVMLQDGAQFFVQIEPEAADMAATRKFVEENDVQKLQKYHIEEQDLIMYETEVMGTTSFWFDANITAGETKVYCRSGRGAHSYSKPQIEVMLKACKTLQAK